MYRRFYIQYNSIGTNAIKQVKVVAEKSAEDMDGNGTKVRNDASLEKNDFLGKYGTIPDLQEIIIPEALESKAEYERTLIS